MSVDENLLADLARGSHEAFEQLFEAHVDFVFNVAFRRIGSDADTEEIVADVFTELWRQRADLHSTDGSLRPWLAGTAANLARRHWRTMERRRRALTRLESRSDLYAEDLADRAVASVDDGRRARRLQAALQDLPPDQYIVLTLSVWERLSHHEIAEALGVAVGTVKSRLSRARTTIERSIGTETALATFPVHRSADTPGDQPTVRAEGGRS